LQGQEIGGFRTGRGVERKRVHGRTRVDGARGQSGGKLFGLFAGGEAGGVDVVGRQVREKGHWESGNLENWKLVRAVVWVVRAAAGQWQWERCIVSVLR
jgi:hypothetical protein